LDVAALSIKQIYKHALETALFARFLGQALCASDTNSDAPYSFLRRGRELCVSKERPPAVC